MTGSTHSFGRRIDVTHFGAEGDGTTDDSPAFQLAASRLRHGDTLWLPSGKSFRLNTQVAFDLSDRSIAVAGDGTPTIIQGGPAHLLKFFGTYPQIVTGSNPTTATVVTDPAAPGSTTLVGQITVSAALTGVQPGDRIVIVAEDQIPGTHVNANGIMRLAEVVTVHSINGSTITLTGIPTDWDSYATGLKVMVQNRHSLGLRGFNMAFADEGDAAGWTQTLVQFYNLSDLRVEDVTVHQAVSKVFEVGGIDGFAFDRVSVMEAKNDGANNRYGYGIFPVGYSENGRIDNCLFRNCRHGITSATTHFGGATTRYAEYGSPKDIVIADSVAESCSGSGFDTHSAARRWRFEGCLATDAWRGSTSIGAGFQSRGTDITFSGCHSHGSAHGWHISDQGTAGVGQRNTLVDCTVTGAYRRAVLVNGVAAPIEGTVLEDGFMSCTHGSSIVQVVNESSLDVFGTRFKGAPTMSANSPAISMDGGNLFARDPHFDIADIAGTAQGAKLQANGRIELYDPTYNMRVDQNFARGTGTAGRVEVLNAKCVGNVFPSDPVWGAGSTDWRYWDGAAYVNGNT